MYSATKPRAMMLNEIKGVTLVTPTDDNKTWYQAIFSITLEKKRVFLKTNKEMWLVKQTEQVMNNAGQKMIKRATMLQKYWSELLQTALIRMLCWRILWRVASLPWEKAWVSFEKERHNKEIDIVWSMDLGLQREALVLCGDMYMILKNTCMLGISNIQE